MGSVHRQPALCPGGLDKSTAYLAAAARLLPPGAQDGHPEFPVLHLSGILATAIANAAACALQAAATHTDISAEEAVVAEGIGAAQTLLGEELAALLKAVRHQLAHGLGACLIRGFDAAGLEDMRQRRIALLLLGMALGCMPTLQSADLKEIVGDVRCRPPGEGDREFRGYRNPNDQMLHNDSTRPAAFGSSMCDIIVMHCVQPSTTGGRNKFLRAKALHQALQAERPDLYARLRSPCWPWCGEKEWVPEWGPQEDLAGLPVLRGDASGSGGELQPAAFGVIYGKVLRVNVEAGFRRRGETMGQPMTPADAEALNFLQEVANREVGLLHGNQELGFKHRLEGGDVLLLNNFAWMHARESFPEAEQRHLLRLWLRLCQ